MANKQKSNRRKKRKYIMTVAGQMFNHLGLQMYSGAVPAISELISNAYDAMARNVWINIPTGRAIEQDDIIEVKDDGHGMSHEDCNLLYLTVGRNRRSNQNEWTNPYNGLNPRKVQGRKGIGKLAGFGISNLISVRAVRNNEVAHFAMDFDELTRSSNFAEAKGYNPEVLQDDGSSTTDSPGTTIELSRLVRLQSNPDLGRLSLRETLAHL